MYDEILGEARQHKVTNEWFSKRLADAERSRAALYPQVQEKIRAQEAEEQRQAKAKALRDEAERQAAQAKSEPKKLTYEEELEEKVKAGIPLADYERREFHEIVQKRLDETMRKINAPIFSYNTRTGELKIDTHQHNDYPDHSEMERMRAIGKKQNPTLSEIEEYNSIKKRTE
jgi:hypothetical protein